jgi:hypothetical protein
VIVAGPTLSQKTRKGRAPQGLKIYTSGERVRHPPIEYSESMWRICNRKVNSGRLLRTMPTRVPMSRTLRIIIFSGLYFVCRLLLSLWRSSHWIAFEHSSGFLLPIGEAVAFGVVFDVITQYLWKSRQGESQL